METKNMSLGKLGDPSIQFIRKYRFTLDSDILDGNFVINPSIDYVNKTIRFSVMKIVHEGMVMANDFVQDMMVGSAGARLVLSCYSPDGKILCQIVFTDLILQKATEDYDYSKSDVATIDFIIGFKWHKVIFPETIGTGADLKHKTRSNLGLGKKKSKTPTK
jgi:hypothetical protein